MRLGDFLLGQRVDIALPLPPAVCAQRLKALLPPHEWSFLADRLIGQVQDDLVVLRYSGSMWQRRLRHELSGRLIAAPSGARLVGRFGSTFSVFFAVVWTAAVFLSAFGRGWPPVFGGVILSSGIVPILGFLFFLIFPWLLLLRFGADAGYDLRGIEAAITQACAA